MGIVIILITAIVLLSDPLPGFAQKTGSTGDLVSRTSLAHYTKQEIDVLSRDKYLKNLLSQAGALGPAQNAVNAYLVEYGTANTDETVVTVSDVLLLSDRAPGQLPSLSFQHGTIFERRKSPSTLAACSETILMPE